MLQTVDSCAERRSQREVRGRSNKGQREVKERSERSEICHGEVKERSEVRERSKKGPSSAGGQKRSREVTLVRYVISDKNSVTSRSLLSSRCPSHDFHFQMNPMWRHTGHLWSEPILYRDNQDTLYNQDTWM